MEGLNADEVNLSETRDASDDFRVDSNYFHSNELLAKLDLLSARSLGQICEWITQGPNPVFLDDGEVGVPCLTGRNIRGHTITVDGADIVSDREFAQFTRFHLRKGDILVTLKGAGSTGKMALVEDTLPMMFSRNVGLIRLRTDKLDMAEYVYAYFSSKYGQELIDRGVTGGTGQLTLPTGYLKRVPIPQFQRLVKRTVEIVGESKRRGGNASAFMAQAEQTLLRALRLEGWEAPELLTYTRRASEALTASRLDAEHFRPKFAALLAKMKEHGEVVRLGDCVRFCERGRQPLYAEEGLPVINSRHVRANNVVLDEDNRFATEDPAQLKLDAEHSFTIKQGDLLINGTGVGTMGRCAPYLRKDKALPDNHVTILRIKPKLGLDPVFLSLQLNSIIGQMQVEQYFKGSSGQIELYPSEIKEFRIWLAPLKIQQQIKFHLEQAHLARQEAQALLARAKRAVEIAIEDGEAAALAFLKAK